MKPTSSSTPSSKPRDSTSSNILSASKKMADATNEIGGVSSSSTVDSFEFPTFHGNAAASTGTDQVDVKSTSAESHRNPTEAPEDLNVFVNDLLEQMQNKFQTMGKSIIGRIDDLGSRIDELEHSVSTLAEQADTVGTNFGGPMTVPRSPTRRNHRNPIMNGDDDNKFETNFDPFECGSSISGTTTVTDSGISMIKEDQES